MNIDYRIEDRITKHSKDMELKQSTLDKTYNYRDGVKRTNDAVMGCGLGANMPEAAFMHEHRYLVCLS
jgi:hypothetical protein